MSSTFEAGHAPAAAVHFVGISGIGMSALARILLQRGGTVTGSSDRATALTARLGEEGATVAIGHDARNVAGAGRVVVSSAIDPANPEVLEARRRGLEIVRRGDLLAEMMRAHRGIAIAGTHGKTTTTAMVARVLEAGGVDPTVVIGGERVDTGTNARCGAGPWLLTEADESDRSFLALAPEIAVVTNVEGDHISSNEELPELYGSFETFLAALPSHGFALVGIGEVNETAREGFGGRAARDLAARPRAARTLTFGFDRTADVRVSDAVYANFGSTFTVAIRGETVGTFSLQVPGEINVLDAVPAIVIGLELGVPAGVIARALAGFCGVRRRFDILTRSPRAIVVDDYAHHPTAVGSTIEAARLAHAGPIVVAFQPHRYTRTQYLASDFARELGKADRVVLTDVYAASEDPIPGVSSLSIGDRVRLDAGRIGYAPIDRLPEFLLDWAPPGALVLMLGAGSITGAARRLADLIDAGDRAGDPSAYENAPASPAVARRGRA